MNTQLVESIHTDEIFHLTASLSSASNQFSDTETRLKIGPVYFRGKAPFNTRVKVITCLSPSSETSSPEKQYVTFVGFKKDTDSEYEYDEMIPNQTWEGAQQTHEKTCGFFSHSSLFVRMDLATSEKAGAGI
jgi:hypothetical protein